MKRESVKSRGEQGMSLGKNEIYASTPTPQKGEKHIQAIDEAEKKKTSLVPN